MAAPSKTPAKRRTVGGGPKKILYALETAQRIGLKNTGKALKAKNACKACGYGMGGQLGGMTNEQGEFPAVCNKSIQAQSTDIQQPIPASVLAYPLSAFRELDGYEMEHLGRLNDPIFKAAGSDRFETLDWDIALDLATAKLKAVTPERSFFYASGRSSNEAGFVLQLLARAWGTNNVNNCSYYCHQATGVGLASTIGTGTATVELADLDTCDTIFVIGANPASNHPRFIHKLQGVRARGGHVIVINPAREAGLVKFSLPKSPRSLIKGGDDIASAYLQPKIGTDILVLKALAKAVLEAGADDTDFVTQHTAGFADFKTDLEALSWQEITARTGLEQRNIVQTAKLYGQSTNAVFAWGMGVTHHVHGSDTVEQIANLALLRGMIGRPGAGLLPLRGHSNVQGIGTVGVKPVLAEDVFTAMEKATGLTFPREAGFDTLAALEAASEGNVDAAIIMGGNLLAASPERTWTQRAMDKIGFKLFLTTTMNHGHVFGNDDSESLILPVTARDEEWQPTSQESMFNFVRLSDGGIERLSGVRPEVWILTEVAKRLLPDCAFDFGAFQNHSTIREAIAATVPGLEDLASLDVARQEFHIKGRLMHTPAFKTEDGRGHFQVRTPPPKVPDDALMLTTVRSEGQFNTIIYEREDSYRGKAGRRAVMMHADDIASAGHKEGDIVTLKSEHGRMDKAVLTSFDIARGSVMAYFPEANDLIGRTRDPRSKTPAFKSTPVWIETPR